MKQGRTNHRISRRRFLAITGLASISAGGVWALRRNESPKWNWQGVLFGADVSISLHGLKDETRAKALSELCFQEMQRLEQMFSLFVPDSVLCRLNRDGRCKDCPREFVSLVTEANRLHAQTHGAFDATVQPLWKAMDEHDFLSGPLSHKQLTDALAKIGGDRVRVKGNTVFFSRPGMEMTLNGIAQGFITDIITGLLRRNGVEQALVNMGEYRAIGRHTDGRAWNLGIRAPGDENGVALMDTVSLEDQALAVSGGYGYAFDAGRVHHHLLNPKTGENLPADRSVAVTAATATIADALSTACAVLDDDAAYDLCDEFDCKLQIYRDTA